MRLKENGAIENIKKRVFDLKEIGTKYYPFDSKNEFFHILSENYTWQDPRRVTLYFKEISDVDQVREDALDQFLS